MSARPSSKSSTPKTFFELGSGLLILRIRLVNFRAGVSTHLFLRSSVDSSGSYLAGVAPSLRGPRLLLRVSAAASCCQKLAAYAFLRHFGGFSVLAASCRKLFDDLPLWSGLAWGRPCPAPLCMTCRPSWAPSSCQLRVKPSRGIRGRSSNIGVSLCCGPPASPVRNCWATYLTVFASTCGRP